MPASIADRAVYCSYLDGLRGIAVLMVLAAHTSQRVGNDQVGQYLIPIVDEFLDAGARGVQLFFVLSALTLFASLDHRIGQERAPAVNFYIRRAFRILPFWWLTVILYALVEGRGMRETLPSILMYFGFIRYQEGVDIHPIGWTVFVECTFYLLIPLLFLIVTSLKRAALLYVFTLITSVGWWKLAPRFGVPTANEFVYEFPLTQWFCFALGIIVYFVRKEEFVAALEKLPWGRWVMDGGVLFLLWALLRGYYGFATIALTGLCLAAVSEQTYWGRLARVSWLGQFGICCYSIYLMHFGILDLLDPVKAILLEALGLTGAAVEARFLVWFPLAALANLCCGFIAYTMVERPCVNLGKRLIAFFERRGGGAAAVVA